MNNDNTELLKLVGLHNYDVDRNKTKVYVDPTTSVINIDLFFERKITQCKRCLSKNTVIKETIKKELNHCIKPCQRIDIIYHQKKFKCKDCETTFMEENKLTNGGNRITIYGQIEMINSLRNPRKTFSDVAIERFTTAQTVINYFDDMVDINRHHLTNVVCFDEIYSKKLTRTKYAFCIYDPFSNTILDVLNARRKNVLEEYFVHIPAKERLNVRYVNIDMWTTYVDIAERYLPNATICVDSFHVIEHLNDAMYKIRLQIQRKFIKDKNNDRNGYYWLLKTFHYYFTMDIDNIKYTRKPRSHYSYLFNKYDVLDKLLSIDESLEAAYRLKEEYREFNLTEEYSKESIIKLQDFIEKFKKSPFIEFREFGSLLDNWKIYIVNSFLRIKGKRMSNGPMESVNGRTKRILADGYGYSDFKRFRNRVMFSLNKNEPIKIK